MRILLYRFPWNQGTLLGWLAEAFISPLFPVTYGSFVTTMFTLFASICKYHGAFFKMFKLQIKNIDEASDVRPFQSVRVKQLLSESVSFHVSAKE